MKRKREPALDRLERHMFPDFVKAREDGKCPFCKTPVLFEEFRDQRSQKEYDLSGLCQACQDDIFGKE